MSQLACEGWWDQRGLGRQPMDQLSLKFGGGAISGSGTDIVGPFSLIGSIDSGSVVLLKRYLGKHCVDYFGSYDGEGTLHGDWEVSGMRGPWLIKILRPMAASTRNIVEISAGS